MTGSFLTYLGQGIKDVMTKTKKEQFKDVFGSTQKIKEKVLKTR